MLYRRRQRFSFDDLDDGIHAGINTRIELAALEIRGNNFGHDAPGSRIVQNAFQTVADFDTQFAVILRNE